MPAHLAPPVPALPSRACAFGFPGRPGFPGRCEFCRGLQAKPSGSSELEAVTTPMNEPQRIAAERGLEALRLRRTGLTWREVGRAFGVSPSRATEMGKHGERVEEERRAAGNGDAAASRGDA